MKDVTEWGFIGCSYPVECIALEQGIVKGTIRVFVAMILGEL